LRGHLPHILWPSSARARGAGGGDAAPPLGA
jgi:hypothetical protein